MLHGEPKQSFSDATGDESSQQEHQRHFRSVSIWRGQILSLSCESTGMRFSDGGSDVGRRDLVTHPIRTGDAAPIKQPRRRVSYALRPLTDQQIRDDGELVINQTSVVSDSCGEEDVRNSLCRLQASRSNLVALVGPCGKIGSLSNWAI